MAQLPDPDKHSWEAGVPTSREVNHWYSTSQIYPDTGKYMQKKNHHFSETDINLTCITLYQQQFYSEKS